MTGFLLNMIHRHQGAVDTVQPRMRSMFEPEPAPAVARDKAFASTGEETARDSLNTGVEMRSAFAESENSEKSAPENPLLAPLPEMLQQTARPGEGFRSTEMNSLDKNRRDFVNELNQKQSFDPKSPKVEKTALQYPPSTPLSERLNQAPQPDEGLRISELSSSDKNRMDLMNEQIRSVLARFGRASETSVSVNDPVERQKIETFGSGDKITTKVLSDDSGLDNRIEETLRRLKPQTSIIKEEQHGYKDHQQLSPVNTIKIEADPLKILPSQLETKGERDGEQIRKSVFDQNHQDTDSTHNQSGYLQTPAWLLGMQAELNNRWREINAHSQAEPVINVTIGRVEVRAVNPSPTKPDAAQKKPTGVMSLEEYLKRRESKGGK